MKLKESAVTFYRYPTFRKSLVSICIVVFIPLFLILAINKVEIRLYKQQDNMTEHLWGIVDMGRLVHSNSPCE